MRTSNWAGKRKDDQVGKIGNTGLDAVKTMRKITFRGMELENWDWLSSESMKGQSMG